MYTQAMDTMGKEPGDGQKVVRSAEEMRHYYAMMGPMYARSHDAATGDAGRARTIHSPEPLNRAFGPEGFLRRFDLRGELGRITAPTQVLAGRHDWICPPEFSEEPTE